MSLNNCKNTVLKWRTRFIIKQILLNFWNSPEYRKAKKLREGLMDVNFIIAIDSI
ncbi:MAG: DUF1330 domain-containing protein [Candidatus Latescibacteria bacterium]|nr:DUF1330 domain-containing protein [Candidatus Latescibacterota bacterium]